MARRKRSALAPLQLPASVEKDINSLSGIVARFSALAEKTLEDVFEWGKKHKFLVATAVILIAVQRYLLDEGESRDEEEEDY